LRNRPKTLEELAKKKKQQQAAAGGITAIGVVGVAAYVYNKYKKDAGGPDTTATHMAATTASAEKTEVEAASAQESVQESLDAVIKRDWEAVTRSLVQAGIKIFDLRIQNYRTLISNENAKKAHAYSSYVNKKQTYDSNLGSWSAFTFLSGEMDRSKKAMDKAKKNSSSVSGQTAKAISGYNQKISALSSKKKEFQSKSGKYFEAARKNFEKERKKGIPADVAYKSVNKQLTVEINKA
jgi:type II secretory pathway pseudopilin PulG